MNEDWRNTFGILMCTEICDGAGLGLCDGSPSTCSSYTLIYSTVPWQWFYKQTVKALIRLRGCADQLWLLALLNVECQEKEQLEPFFKVFGMTWLGIQTTASQTQSWFSINWVNFFGVHLSIGIFSYCHKPRLIFSWKHKKNISSDNLFWSDELNDPCHTENFNTNKQKHAKKQKHEKLSMQRNFENLKKNNSTLNTMKYRFILNIGIFYLTLEMQNTTIAVCFVFCRLL